MNINTNNISNFRSFKPNKKQFGAEESPLKYNVSFTANPTKAATKAAGNAEKVIVKITREKGFVEYSDAPKITEKLYNILGEKYIKDLSEKSGIKLDGDELKYADRTFLGDIKNTFLDIAGISLNLIHTVRNKIKPKYLESSSDIFAKWAKNKEKNRAANQLIDIIEQFADLKKGKRRFELGEASESFKEIVSKNVASVKKNYDTRDERALNRLATSTVSALFSGADFYNASMLQKDDEEDAKKSRNNRIGQEVRRMLMSAGATYFSLSVFDRYTKGNIFLNSLVIAGSALASEMFSRVASGTSLVPLTPEQAAKIAQKRKVKNSKQNEVNIQKNEQSEKKENVNFKANLKTEEQIFKAFLQNQNPVTFANIVTTVDENAAKEETSTQEPSSKIKNKTKGWTIFAIATLAVNAYYFLSKYLKGDYDCARKAFDNIFEPSFNAVKENLTDMKNSVLAEKLNFEEHKVSAVVDDYLKQVINGSRELNEKDCVDFLNKKYDLDIIQDELGGCFGAIKQCYQDDARELIDSWEEQSKKFDIGKKIEKKITKKANINLEELNKKLTTLTTLKNNPNNDAATIELLEKYQSDIDGIKNKTNYSVDKKRPFLNGLYSGVTKIFTTINTVLSMPAILIDNLVFKEKNAAVKYLKSYKGKNLKKQFIELEEICKKVGKDSTENEKAIAEILKRARNVQISADTGELANYSRTMVVAISSYFFVNDYRNNVLIESEGKDVKGANVEAKERVAHKLSNFIINGTLMNIFNSLFKRTLNSSLIGATAVAAATEISNETLVRKSICQPILQKDSRQAIIDHETKQMNKKGPMGLWVRFYKKITGKKSLTQKAGFDTQKIEVKKDKQIDDTKTISCQA